MDSNENPLESLHNNVNNSIYNWGSSSKIIPQNISRFFEKTDQNPYFCFIQCILSYYGTVSACLSVCRYRNCSSTVRERNLFESIIINLEKRTANFWTYCTATHSFRNYLSSIIRNYLSSLFIICRPTTIEIRIFTYSLKLVGIILCTLPPVCCGAEVPIGRLSPISWYSFFPYSYLESSWNRSGGKTKVSFLFNDKTKLIRKNEIEPKFSFVVVRSDFLKK